MLDLSLSRPTPSDSSRPPRPASRNWGDRASDWLRSVAEAVVRAGSTDSIISRFAEIAALAREPEEVRVALVQLASRVTGGRAELLLDRPGGPARRLAIWPPIASAEATAQPRSATRGPISAEVARTIQERPAPAMLQIPLKAGDSVFGTLRLTPSRRRPWSARVVHHLGTLCAIAAVAERGLSHPSKGNADPILDPGQGPHGSMLLLAFLAFAQSQARRRREPLSLLELAIDRLDSIRALLGEEVAEVAIDRAARAIKATVRASDVVVRLEDGRIAILLPNASAENAMKIAEAVRTAIARAGAASTTMPTLTTSIGVASYPDHAHDVTSLRAAASSTLTRARDQGPDRIASAVAIASPPPLGLAQRVG